MIWYQASLPYYFPDLWTTNHSSIMSSRWSTGPENIGEATLAVTYRLYNYRMETFPVEIVCVVFWGRLYGELRKIPFPLKAIDNFLYISAFLEPTDYILLRFDQKVHSFIHFLACCWCTDSILIADFAIVRTFPQALSSHNYSNRNRIAQPSCAIL